MKAYTPEKLQALVDSMPLKRVGTPEDILAAVAYFASPAGAYATGQVIYLDGGLTLM